MIYDVAHALEIYQAMERAAIARNDTPMRVSALNKVSYVQSMFLGQFDEAGAALDKAEQLARGCDDRAGLAEGLVMRCNVSTMKADFEEGVKHLENLVDVGRELNRDFETAFGLVHSANSWTYLARFDKAWPAANEARTFTESRGDLMHLAETLAFSYAFSQLGFGEVAAAYASAEEGVKIGLRIGHLYAVTVGSLVAGSIARWQGDPALAMSHFERGLDAAKTLQFPFAIAMLMAAMCGTLVEQDVANFDVTREMHEQVMQLLAHPMGTVGGGSAWADLGECALALGRYDIAREHFQRGLTTPTVMKYLNRPRFLIGLARVELAQGRMDEAVADVAEARAFAEAHKMLWWYPMISLAEADVNAALSHDAGALECYRSAEAQAAWLGMTPVAEKASEGAMRLAAIIAREQMD
jgi:tetratricopeptide (TPR) repeat protein